MMQAARSNGRTHGRGMALSFLNDENWGPSLVLKARGAVHEIPPRPRLLSRRDVGIGILILFALMVVVPFALASTGRSDSAYGALVLIMLTGWIGLVVVAVRGVNRDTKVFDERIEWLTHVWFDAALMMVQQRVDDARIEVEREDAAHRARAAARPNPAPLAQPYGVSPRGAELIVCEWMRHLGALDAETTQFTGDGGVDVSSDAWIAQVKHYQGTVGVQSVRELVGVAAVDGRRALFFTSTGYAAGAAEFAERAGVGLFTYSAEEGELSAANDLAASFLEHGLN
ncbi:hypothetical protein GCM10027421_10330 [Microbacterium shaanxiense]